MTQDSIYADNTIQHPDQSQQPLQQLQQSFEVDQTKYDATFLVGLNEAAM